MMKLIYSLLCDKPVPTWLVRVPEGTHFFTQDYSSDLPIELLGCQFRGVPLSKLGTVLSTGIDVEPSDSVIFSSDIQKVSEYGEWPKLLLALEASHLKCTFMEMDSTIADKELATLFETYPTKRTSRDGTRIWLSRMSSEDRRIAPDYEVNYAKWIPGDAINALKAALICYRPEDEEELKSAVRSFAQES